eukprot:CAMPEP_0172503996 /NCGR_PEP_ID=MMETSP1066-20121228/174465_1 /TAXON_ID=671091 /ORGANISM="Coscinodiscus wailesii, Strain CCMP2513" /LENGTH=191 /DNA_ID=CAMNT_0013279967 /DNA_START=21 /DNA_END=596 /DNA_ORIENTATION=+
MLKPIVLHVVIVAILSIILLAKCGDAKRLRKQAKRGDAKQQRKQAKHVARRTTGQKILEAEMGRYPGVTHTGIGSVRGHVRALFWPGASMTVQYDFEGVEEFCRACVIAIHTGMSCDTDKGVGIPYWNALETYDVWSNDARYQVSERKGKGQFGIVSGYGYDENVGHAIVIYAKDGTKIGCGVLRESGIVE